MIAARKQRGTKAAPLAALGAREAAESVAAWAAVDAASVYVRDMGDDEPRVIVHAAGIGSWNHSHETSSARFAKRFPSLGDRTIADLVRAIDGRAVIAAQGGVKAAAQRNTRWMNWTAENTDLFRI